MKTPTLAGFRFIKLLGAGEFGEVWLAEDIELRQLRAVKFLRREHFNEAKIEEFITEARHMAALPKHPNRVQVHYAKRGIANCFFVMEFIEGGTLLERSRMLGCMSWPEATRYVLGVAKGLVDLHDQGVLHRDIKPDNILWNSTCDEAVLADFGLAQETESNMGTVAKQLMAHERLQDDVYALTATLYFLISGHWPSKNLEEMPFQSLGIPHPLETLMRKGLNLHATHRVPLVEYVARLRNVRWSELASTLASSNKPLANRIELMVKVAHSGPEAPDAFRDLDIVDIHTNDLLRLTVNVAAHGYVTILAVPPAGNLTVAFPDEVNPNNKMAAGRPRHFVFTLLPPSGMETFMIIWTKRKVRGDSARWQAWIEQQAEKRRPARIRPRVNMRTAELVSTWEDQLPEGSIAARVVEVCHAG